MYMYIYIYIRHSDSCEGVFSDPVAWTGLFSAELRDPRIPEKVGPGFLRVSFLRFFFSFVFQGAFLTVLWPTWPQHGSKLGPKRPPESRKIYKKGIISCMLFLIEFLLMFGTSWMDFWWIWIAKLGAKLTKKSIIWPLVGKLAEVAKMLQNYCAFNTFGSLGLPTSRQNSIKSVPRPIKIQVKIWSAA